MKHMFFLILLFSFHSFAMGDPSGLNVNTHLFRDTTENLNQVTKEPDVPVLDSQEQQEKIYEEDQEREQRQWDDDKKYIDQYRYDVPEQEK